jgi:hypothetical protein
MIAVRRERIATGNANSARATRLHRNRNSGRAWIALLSAMTVASPCMGQSQPPKDNSKHGDDIVVTGKKAPSRREVFEQARRLSVASRDYNEALARFVAPVCPGVIGFRTDAAELIVDRIRQNAARLGVRLAPSECTPNLVVAVADDGRASLVQLARENPRKFAFVATPEERIALLRDEGPVRVWSNILTMSAPDQDDTCDPSHEPAALVPHEHGKEVLPTVWGQTCRWFLPFQRDIASAVVVFDRNAVIGMTLVQLADYATMRGLTHTRPATGSEPTGTILALFADGGRGTPELTGFDIAYLRSLYRETADLPAVTKLLEVHLFMARAQKDSSKTGPIAATQPALLPAPAPRARQ